MDEQQKAPFGGFLDITSEMNRMRNLGSYGYDPGQAERQRTHATAWVPNADIFVRGADLVVRVDIAGVDPEDIDITVQENMLTISGERKKDVDEDSFYVHERFYGVFRRSMTLPTGTNEDRISAEFKNGLVEITVSGAAEAAEPRRIEIRDKSG